MARSIHKSIPQPEWAKSVVRLRAGLVLNQLPSAMGFTVPQWQYRGGNEEFQSRRRMFTLRWATSPETRCAGISEDEQV
jgi:hypothetical protein